MTIVEDLKRWSVELTSLPQQFFALLADRVVDAIVETDAKRATDLRDDLTSLIDELIKISPELVPKLSSVQSKTEQRQAYDLGKISFAQMLVAKQVQRKADHVDLREAQAEHYFMFLRLLYEREHGNAELAECLGQRLETVSRKLKMLRGWGLTEYRRDGKHVTNFLTVAGRAFVDKNINCRHNEKLTDEILQTVEKIKASSSNVFKDQTSFAQPSNHELEAA